MIPSEPHLYAEYLLTTWRRAKSGVMEQQEANLLRDRLEAVRVHNHAKFRTMPTGTFGWSVNALTWACVAALDVATGDTQDAACATSFEAVCTYRMAIKPGPMDAYTRAEVQHAMTVVSRKWLHCAPSYSLMAYVRALELAAARHIEGAFTDAGMFVTFVAGWTADIKRQYSTFIGERACAGHHVIDTWTAFCDAVVARTASEAQRHVIYKLSCTAWMAPGMVDVYMRNSRSTVIPEAPKLCLSSMVSNVHSRARARILYDPLTSFVAPRDDPVTLGIVLFSAFDAWCKHKLRLHWAERFVLMLVDWKQAQYALKIRAREPVVVQRLGGFDVWHDGESVNCFGSAHRALYNWYFIIETRYESRVLGKHVLPLLAELKI